MIRKISPAADNKPLREMGKSERRAIIERFAPMLGISVKTERAMCFAEQELGDLTAKGLELLLIDQAHRDGQSQNRPIHMTGEYNPFEKHWEP